MSRITRPFSPGVLVLVAACVSVAAIAAPTWAATVELRSDVPVGPMSGRYSAGAGERNDVAVTSGSQSSFRVHDAGAAITAGAGCTSLTANNAECIGNVWGLLFVRVDLGDGDDVLRPTATRALKVHGGLGDDRLLGGASVDELDGGGGMDELHGNGGSDLLEDGDGVAMQPLDADVLDGGAGGGDWVSYEHRTVSVAVDLADRRSDGSVGEGDVLTGIENVHGGLGDDRLVGDAGDNWFMDAGGRNQIRGRAGEDFVRGARAGSVNCGPGDDQVRGATKRVVLTRNCELLVDPADFIEVTPFPRLIADGLAFDFPPQGEDPPIGSMVVTEARGQRRRIARGAIRWTHPGATARLRLTAVGRGLLGHMRVRATVRVLGGDRALSWSIVLPRRQA
jgi:hypothetical protein